jgi:hypothetical protein
MRELGGQLPGAEVVIVADRDRVHADDGQRGVLTQERRGAYLERIVDALGGTGREAAGYTGPDRRSDVGDMEAGADHRSVTSRYR